MKNTHFHKVVIKFWLGQSRLMSSSHRHTDKRLEVGLEQWHSLLTGGPGSCSQHPQNGSQPSLTPKRGTGPVSDPCAPGNGPSFWPCAHQGMGPLSDPVHQACMLCTYIHMYIHSYLHSNKTFIPMKWKLINLKNESKKLLRLTYPIGLETTSSTWGSGLDSRMML